MAGSLTGFFCPASVHRLRVTRFGDCEVRPRKSPDNILRVNKTNSCLPENNRVTDTANLLFLAPRNSHSQAMADNPATSGEPAVDAAAAAVAKLHLDEVTGEMISKTELKKRQKQREKEAAKEKKAAENPKPKAASNKSAEAAEKELTPNQVCILELRFQKENTKEREKTWGKKRYQFVPMILGTASHSIGIIRWANHHSSVLRNSVASRQRAPRSGQGLSPQGNCRPLKALICSWNGRKSEHCLTKT